MNKLLNENVEDLFNVSNDPDEIKLDIKTPKSQSPITTLPKDFRICSMSSIRQLQEYVSINFSKGQSLFRGHESNKYLIESTIVRLAKQNNVTSIQKIVEGEKKGFDIFNQTIFKQEWLNNNYYKANETLYKLSIGRHLGLPCRLIDVTNSLEVAVFFAVMNPRYYNEDGEIILIVLEDKVFFEHNCSPFCSTSLSFVNDPFYADSLNDLPLGEQRRFRQYGRFIWVNDKSLLNEQQKIRESANFMDRFIIPKQAKSSLAADLYRDLYSGTAYQSEIEKIKAIIF